MTDKLVNGSRKGASANIRVIPDNNRAVSAVQLVFLTCTRSSNNKILRSALSMVVRIAEMEEARTEDEDEDDDDDDEEEDEERAPLFPKALSKP